MGIYRKKRGVTFLEIVLSLSILGIISTAIFANIDYCLRRNKESEYIQISSVATSNTYETIENMNQEKFKELLEALKNDTAYDLKLQGFNEIPSSEKIAFKESGENLNSFKVYKKQGRRSVFVKIGFKDLDFTKDSYGLEIIKPIQGKVAEYTDWATADLCDVNLFFKKDNDGKIVLSLMNKGAHIFTYTSRFVENIDISILFDGTKFIVRYMNELTQDISVIETVGRMYVSNKSGIEIPILLDNISKDRLLEVYTDQDTSKQDEKIKFMAGENIEFKKSDSNINPFGESILTESQCEFSVKVYNDDMKVLDKIEGNKTFTRFKR